MAALFVLIPLALVLLAVAVVAFLWAVDHDQFEDLDREGERILHDEETTPPTTRERPGATEVDVRG